MIIRLQESFNRITVYIRISKIFNYNLPLLKETVIYTYFNKGEMNYFRYYLIHNFTYTLEVT